MATTSTTSTENSESSEAETSVSSQPAAMSASADTGIEPSYKNVVVQLVLGPVAANLREAPKALAHRWVEIEEVTHTCTRTDGVAPFSEQFLRGMHEPELEHWHVLARVDGHIRGVAAVDPGGVAVEMAVHPDFRRQGVASSLGRAVRSHARSIGLGEPRNIYTGSMGLTWWAHGDLPAARSLAKHAGAEKVRELLVMVVRAESFTKLDQESLQEKESSTWGSDIQVLNYTDSAEKFGVEFVDAAWLAVNNEAFHWHPEQGGWDQNRLDRARKTSWYDPAGVLFLWDAGSPAQNGTPVLLGFHWTKLPGCDDCESCVGEVYVIGLADRARGKGWGRELTAEGIRYLISRGATDIELYVEGDNAPAVKAYEALGFSVAERHTAWKM